MSHVAECGPLTPPEATLDTEQRDLVSPGWNKKTNEHIGIHRFNMGLKNVCFCLILFPGGGVQQYAKHFTIRPQVRRNVQGYKSIII